MAETEILKIPEIIGILTNQTARYSVSQTGSPMVSIISSFYNAHHYFEETYRSVTSQTMQNFEWIIVDDRSTDPESLTLFGSLKNRSDKIKTFHHLQNKGPTAGRNTAVSKASGKYLFFMDCDDLIDPTYLEKCVLFLELHPEFSFVNSWAMGFQAQSYRWTHGFEKAAQFIEQNWVTLMLMYRRSDFDRLGGFDESLHSYKIYYEDWERWLKALSAGQKGWTIPEYLHFYRRRETGILSASLSNIENEKTVRELFNQKYSRQFKEDPPLPISWSEPPTPYDVSNIRKKLDIENLLESEKFAGKRVLFSFPHLNVGGADKFNVDLLTLLKEKQYLLTVMTTLKSENEWHDYIYKITQDIFHLPNYCHQTAWFSVVCYLIESRQIDIVFISNSYISYYMLPLLRNKYKNTAFIDYVHAYDPGWRVDGYPRLSRQFSSYLDEQIVSSRHLAEYNEQLEPLTKEKFSVCTTNINPKDWEFSKIAREQIRLLHNISDKTVLLIFPARLELQKRPSFFVRIINELVSRNLPVKAIILGTGSLADQTENLINELGLNFIVTVMPPVTHDLMKAYYSAGDILLLPTLYEGIALSLFEAMAMQLPVIASDVGGQRELIIEGTGALVELGIGDQAEIENYCQKLVPLISDSELRQKTGRAARQRIESFFSLDAMGNCVEKLFVKALNHRKNDNQELTGELIAEEMLTVALECSRIEKELVSLQGLLHQSNLSASQNSDYILIKNERDLLIHQMKNMEASKFWKIRNQWFKLKYKTGLTGKAP